MLSGILWIRSSAEIAQSNAPLDELFTLFLVGETLRLGLIQKISGWSKTATWAFVQH